jgi:hypothetical protein
MLEKICEGCEEETAVKRLSGMGWLCQECIDSYKDLNEDETNVKELTEDEIDKLCDEEESEDEGLDEHELQRQGFSLDKDEDND